MKRCLSSRDLYSNFIVIMSKESATSKFRIDETSECSTWYGDRPSIYKPVHCRRCVSASHPHCAFTLHSDTPHFIPRKPTHQQFPILSTHFKLLPCIHHHLNLQYSHLPHDHLQLQSSSEPRQNALLDSIFSDIDDLGTAQGA